MNEELNEKKISKALIVFAIILMMLLTFCIGLFVGKKLFETKSENKKDNNQEQKNNETKDDKPKNDTKSNNNTIIVNIKDDLKNGKKFDNISVKFDYCFYNVVIGEKEIMGDCDPFNEIGTIYKIEDNYLITTHGTDINTDRYYLYNNKGELLQEIYELEDSMIMATSDKYRHIEVSGNIIELNGTRIGAGPSLYSIENGERTDYYICDKDLLTKANVTEDYVVRARYQLIYNSNKFEIKRIAGTEETLKENLKYCRN